MAFTKSSNHTFHGGQFTNFEGTVVHHHQVIHANLLGPIQVAELTRPASTPPASTVSSARLQDLPPNLYRERMSVWNPNANGPLQITNADQERRFWGEYTRVSTGKIHIKRSIGDAQVREQDEENRSWRHVVAYRTFNHVELQDQGNSDFLYVTYRGQDASEAFHRDFKQFSRVRNLNVAQLFGYNDTLPALIFYDALVPVAHIWEQNKFSSLLYIYFEYVFGEVHVSDENMCGAYYEVAVKRRFFTNLGPDTVLIRIMITQSQISHFCDQEVAIYYALHPRDDWCKLADSWLSQAHSVLSRCGLQKVEWKEHFIAHGFWLYLRCEHQRALKSNDISTKPIYLFTRPIPRPSDSKSIWNAWTEGKKYFWSFNRSGGEEISEDTQLSLGLPSFTSRFEIRHNWWDDNTYNAIRQLHVFKGFDPQTTDFAQSLGLPNFRIVGQARFDHITDTEAMDVDGEFAVSLSTIAANVEEDGMNVD
ncbi:hypothetical protein Moror_9261 [Moniliophthora roreri MCA 2997]|uniref:Uncharacterized protein n=1 Tax=Moniliophthora roreri (strain MCA 2997) TaxID=1381753 RepID=V2WWK1_MONRO|nr:hypothetical protein Moror_9261 [Moniliophthora roreri MCA 2997]